MKRNSLWTLSALLVVQLAAALWLAADHRQGSREQQTGPLLTLAPEQVDRIRIEEPEQPALELVKQDGRWRLPGYYGLAAQDSKVDSLLRKLGELNRTWPVATTEASAKRFEVAADKHQRKLVLSQGGQEQATLYLGTSPGMRQTHVRRADESDVYALGLNHHDLPAQAKDWVDTGLLQVGTTELSRIEGPDFVLSRNEGQWRLEGLNEQEVTDEGAVQRLLGSLRNLRFLEALGTEAKAEYNLEQPLLTLTLHGSGEPVSYQIGKPADADYLVLKSSALAPYFKVSSAQLEQVIGLKRESLAKLKDEQPASGDESGQDGEGASEATS